MQKYIYVSTVKLVFEIPIDIPDKDAYASDYVSEILTNNLMLNNIIIDWEYEVSPYYDDIGPAGMGLIEMDGVNEGDLLHIAEDIKNYNENGNN